MFTLFAATTGGLIVLGWLAGWYGLVFFASILLAVALVWHMTQNSLILVPENRVAVIYNREKQAFSRLLPTGRHWLAPYAEYVRAEIPTSTAVLEGEVQAYTDGGLPLTIHWSVTYKIEPLKLPAGKQKELGKKLAEKGSKTVRSQTGHFVQQVMSEYSINSLFAPGGRGRFERNARQATANKLDLMGVSVQSVMVKQINMPAHVQSALEDAHERAVQTRSEAEALAQLQQVVSKFSDSDMQRLAELERMRVLGKNGVSMVMPMGVSLLSPHPKSAVTASTAILPADGVQPTFMVN